MSCFRPRTFHLSVMSQNGLGSLIHTYATIPTRACNPQYTTSDLYWLFSQSTWNTETWKHEILTVNYNVHLFFSTSCTAVCPACVHPCIFLADRYKSEMSLFRSRPFHLSVMKPHHMRVWFARRFTANVDRSSLIVIYVCWSWVSDNGWLCK